MSDFTIEFQNGRTDWQWELGVHVADTVNYGIRFHDEFIVPDYTDKFPYFTWTNFRIYCAKTVEKINFWVKEHIYPTQLDPLGRTHQSGDAASTYATYRSKPLEFFDSDRFYFYIMATNQNAMYAPSQSLFDPLMATKAVNSDADIAISSNPLNVPSWLGWNPVTQPLGNNHADAFFISSGASASRTARWIQAWDGTCGHVTTRVISPIALGNNHVSFLDTYSMIQGLSGYWLGCRAGSYIYGKILYSLSDHDIKNNELLVTTGFKSCQMNLGAIGYE